MTEFSSLFVRDFRQEIADIFSFFSIEDVQA